MADVTSAFLRRSIVGFTDQGPLAFGIKSWLDKEAYRINQSSSGASVVFEGIERQRFLRYHLFDFERFIFSAVESAAATKLPYYNRKAQAWPLIKRYYAAFFSAHAILRAMGKAIVRVEQDEARRITEIGQIYCRANFQFHQGIYEFNLPTDRSEEITLTCNLLSEGKGGTHEAFWEYFFNFMKTVSEDVLEKKEVDAVAIVGRIEELLILLRSPKKYGGLKWLARMRNRINYQHQYGVWFPFSESRSPQHDPLKGRIVTNSVVALDFSADDDAIASFKQATYFLICLGVDLATAISSHSTVASNPFKKNFDRLRAECGT